MGLDDYERVMVNSRADLRAWLDANAGREQGVWLVVNRRGQSSPSYDDIVEEGLCFGWIDSTVRVLDETRALQLFTPRRRNSQWSVSNKRRVERLLAAGLMTPRGLAAVEAAKANGAWDFADPIERLEVPDDLAAALAEAGVREVWDGYSPSARKQLLWAIASAKRPETRAKRIAQFVANAAAGRPQPVANHPPPPRRRGAAAAVGVPPDVYVLLNPNRCGTTGADAAQLHHTDRAPRGGRRRAPTANPEHHAQSPRRRGDRGRPRSRLRSQPATIDHLR